MIRIVSPTPDSKKSIVSFFTEVAEGGVSEFGKVVIGIESIGHHRIGGSHRTEYIPGKEAITYLLLDLVHFEGLIDGGDASLAEILFREHVFHHGVVFLNEADANVIFPFGYQETPQAAFWISADALTGSCALVTTPQIRNADLVQ